MRSSIIFENDEEIVNDFLTENVSLFLYSTIRASRPLKILEMGLGYSTLLLSQAIEDVKNEDLSDVKYELINHDLNEFFGSNYTPTFISVDHDQNFISDIEKHLQKYDLLKNVQIVKKDFHEFLEEDEDLYDLIWLDYGDKYIFQKLYNKLNLGGFIFVHSTLDNLAGRLFLAEMKLASKMTDDFEMISFFEPHKKIQNSFTIFKKNFDYPIYSEKGYV